MHLAHLHWPTAYIACGGIAHVNTICFILHILNHQYIAVHTTACLPSEAYRGWLRSEASISFLTGSSVVKARQCNFLNCQIPWRLECGGISCGLPTMSLVSHWFMHPFLSVWFVKIKIQYILAPRAQRASVHALICPSVHLSIYLQYLSIYLAKNNYLVLSCLTLSCPILSYLSNHCNSRDGCVSQIWRLSFLPRCSKKMLKYVNQQLHST